jgi:hypothetical protein
MTTVITLPTYMSLRDWADQIVLDLDPYGRIGNLQDDTQWQDWGMQIINNTSLPETIPVPYYFDDWRDWAERFCQVLA